VKKFHGIQGYLMD